MTISSSTRGGMFLLLAPIVTIYYSVAILIAIFLFRLPEDNCNATPGDGPGCVAGSLEYA